MHAGGWGRGVANYWVTPTSTLIFCSLTRMKLLIVAVCLVAAVSQASCLVNTAKHGAGLMPVANFFVKMKESKELVLK